MFLQNNQPPVKSYLALANLRFEKRACKGSVKTNAIEGSYGELELC